MAFKLFVIHCRSWANTQRFGKFDSTDVSLFLMDYSIGLLFASVRDLVHSEIHYPPFECKLEPERHAKGICSEEVYIWRADITSYFHI